MRLPHCLVFLSWHFLHLLLSVLKFMQFLALQLLYWTIVLGPYAVRAYRLEADCAFSLPWCPSMFTGLDQRDKPTSSTDIQSKALSKETPKETIRFKKRAQAGQAASSASTGNQDTSLGPPGLTPQPKAKSFLCFPESTKAICPLGAQCQYCHDFCCRSSQDHVSHRCSQHVNW